MAQLFLRRADTLVRAAVVGLFLFLAVAGGLTYALWWSPYMTRVGVVIDQPVPFSHQHHVGGLGIDCRYCHGTVETSPSAGMPATDTCMTCHAQVWADAPVLESVRESSRLGIPIQWNRVYDLPGYTYFDHSIHVQKGVACATCHGAVEEMPLTYRARDLYMKTCLECHHRTPYMSATGFVVRAILVFAVWIFVCWRLRHLSRQQDETSGAGPGLALRRLSGPALVALPFAATLAYLDWIISLEKHWYSSVFMLLLCLGQTLSALCLALLMAPRFDVLREMTNEKLLNQWGNLLLALVLLWSYLMYGQLLIVWMGNLPVEIGWYLRRVETGWVLLLAAIVLFHFIIPFAVLLSREAKKRSGMLVSLSAMLLLIHALFDGWVILPSASGHGAVWFAFITFPFIGALWCWRFHAALHAVPLLVKTNPQLAVEHE